MDSYRIIKIFHEIKKIRNVLLHFHNAIVRRYLPFRVMVTQYVIHFHTGRLLFLIKELPRASTFFRGIWEFCSDTLSWRYLSLGEKYCKKSNIMVLLLAQYFFWCFIQSSTIHAKISAILYRVFYFFWSFPKRLFGRNRT